MLLWQKKIVRDKAKYFVPFYLPESQKETLYRVSLMTFRMFL